MFAALATLWASIARLFTVVDKTIKIIEEEIDILAADQETRLLAIKAARKQPKK